MKLRFDTWLMTNEWKVKTQTVHDVRDIVVRELDNSYSHDEMLHIVRPLINLSGLSMGGRSYLQKMGRTRKCFCEIDAATR